MEIPLSNVFVISVASTLRPEGEFLSENDRSTRYSHSGVIKIVTEEIGYGSSGVARLNGNILKQEGDALPITASIPGIGNNIVVGFNRIWSSHLNGSGHFSYQLTSMYHPRNTITASIDIRSP
ncbi:MAG: YolA family protein [Treponema sp.]|jgi:hypothetical protein|nr:YolA family protein [Treponema sp.]